MRESERQHFLADSARLPFLRRESLGSWKTKSRTWTDYYHANEWQQIYLAEARAHAKALSDLENRALLWKFLAIASGAFLLISIAAGLCSHGFVVTSTAGCPCSSGKCTVFSASVARERQLHGNDMSAPCLPTRAACRDTGISSNLPIRASDGLVYAANVDRG